MTTLENWVKIEATIVKYYEAKIAAGMKPLEAYIATVTNFPEPYLLY